MQQKSTNRFYPLRLRLFTINITPVLSVFWNRLSNSNSNIEVILLFILFGLLFSAPTFMVVFLLYQSIRNSGLAVWILKSIIIVVAVIGMVVTLTMIGGSAMPALKWAYAISISIIGYFLKAANTQHKTEVAELVAN